MGLILGKNVSALPVYRLFLTPKSCPWTDYPPPPPQIGFVCVCQPPLFLCFILSLQLLLIFLLFLFSSFGAHLFCLLVTPFFLLVVQYSLPVDLVLSFKGRVYVRKLTLVADPTSSPSQEPSSCRNCQGCHGATKDILVVGLVGHKKQYREEMQKQD